MGRNYCVYIHTSPSNKVYVGITRRNPEKRWRNGTGYSSSPHFNNAIKKYGWDNIKHSVIAKGLTKDEACEMEKSFIALFDSTNPEKGYNGTYGGDTGVKITQDVKDKISSANKRTYSDPRRREELRNRSLGHKHSSESKKKMSESHKGLTHVPTKEWNERISIGLRKRYSDPEMRKEMQKNIERFADLGKKKSMRVEQLDAEMNIIATFSSMKEAFRQTGIKDGNISKCCNGKAKTAGGYIWRFAS